MKACKQCGLLKSTSDFYPAGPVYYDTSCKLCRRKAIAEYRSQNIEKIKAYDRSRGQDEKRKAANRRQYRERISTPKGKARERERARIWAQNYRDSDKRAANTIVGNAIRDGRLIRQPCEKCGYAEHVHAHHEDYAKPLEVMWLCRDCHGRRHREINEAVRNAV